jgi:hypothetical protein
MVKEIRKRRSMKEKKNGKKEDCDPIFDGDDGNERTRK